MATERSTFIPFGNTADPSIDYLLGVMADARATTLERVEGIGKKELHWQYAEGWNTIGVLLQHIISCENFFRIYFIEGRELTKAEDRKWMPGLEMGKYIPQLITDEPVEWYIKELALSRSKTIKAIKALSKEEFYKKRQGYNPKTGCNLAWILYHAAEDEVHHRGQNKYFKEVV